MAAKTATWQGSRVLVNVPKARRFAPWYVTEYRLRAMSKWWFELIGFGLGNPIIYLFAVGLGIGSMISRDVDGVKYLAFLAPALLSSSAMMTAMDECMFPVMEGFVWLKSFWTISATQVTPSQIAIGIWLSGLIRATLTTLLYIAVLLAFGAIPASSVVALLITSVIGGMAFSSMIMAATSRLVEDNQFINIIFRFVVMPLFLFSGTFYPLSLTPIYLQWIGWISPLWHATNLGRFLSYGSSVPLWLVMVHIAYLGLLMLVGLRLSFRTFEKRLQA